MKRFIQIPNIPDGKVSLCIIDGRTPEIIIKALKNEGLSVILTDRCDSLYDGVSYHPDMLFNHIGGNTIISAPNAPERTVCHLEAHGFNIIKGSNPVNRKYPSDTAYNVARIGKYCVCNVRYTDRVLLNCLYEEDVRIIDVKQGYAKCSICIVDDHSIITSDEGIYRTLFRYGFDILKIRSGFIEISGMEYGFIGGSSGLISRDKLFFAGNIFMHPDFEKINEFLKAHNKKIISVEGCKLLDVGTVIPLEEILEE